MQVAFHASSSSLLYLVPPPGVTSIQAIIIAEGHNSQTLYQQYISISQNATDWLRMHPAIDYRTFSVRFTGNLSRIYHMPHGHEGIFDGDVAGIDW
jgi:hypothetical protein